MSQRSTNRNANPYAGLAVLAALFFGANLASSALLSFARVDLTEGGLYTLSAGTRNVLRSLDEPITLRLYVSTSKLVDVPEVKTYAQRVRELLGEYANAARGKIDLRVIDPEPFSEDEDRAQAFGLKGVPINAAGELVYFGLAGTNSTDDQEVVHFFQPQREEFLEYDLTKLVDSLAHPQKKVVGILTTLPLRGGPANPLNPADKPTPWFITNTISQSYEIRWIETRDGSIPDDVDLLLVVHPRGFSSELLYAIDQWVLAGRPLVALVDPFAESQFVPQDPQNPAQALVADRSSDFGPLLDAWGVRFDSSKVVGDRTRSLRVQWRNQVMENVLWLALDRENLRRDDPVTGELKVLRFGVAGFLEPAAGATTAFTPLVETTPEAMVMPRDDAQYGPDPRRFLRDYQPGGTRYALAARVTGPAKSAFPDGAPPPTADAAKKRRAKDDGGDGQEDGATAVHRNESQAPIRVLLVADADLLDDRWWVQTQTFFGKRIGQPVAGNGALVLNMLDVLSGSADLVGLRSRGVHSRPFERVAAIRRDTEDRYRAEEQRLEEKLKDTEKRLNDLQRQKDAGEGATVLSPEQRAELERFQEERTETRRRLREVRHEQARAIESLGTRLELLNAVAVPAVVVATALAASAFRRRRWRRSRGRAAGRAGRVTR